MLLSKAKYLKISTEAIAVSRGLKVSDSIKVKQLGKYSSNLIDSEIGEDLKSLENELIPIREKYIEIARKESTEELMNKKFTELMQSDKDVIDNIEAQNLLYATDVEFNYSPIHIRLKDETFPVELIDIQGVKVDTHYAFISLVEEGFIIIDNE